MHCESYRNRYINFDNGRPTITCYYCRAWCVSQAWLHLSAVQGKFYDSSAAIGLTQSIL